MCFTISVSDNISWFLGDTIVKSIKNSNPNTGYMKQDSFPLKSPFGPSFPLNSPSTEREPKREPERELKKHQKSLSFQSNIDLVIREYECDLQGRVNNAVYLNYFEHARNSFLYERGISLQEMHSAGVDPVVIRAEVDFLQSLYPRMKLRIYTELTIRGAYKMLFYQSIQDKRSQSVYAKGVFTCAILGKKDNKQDKVPIKITESPCVRLLT